MSTFTGFSDEDLIRIKSADSGADNANNNQPTLQDNLPNIKKLDQLGARPKKTPQYKLTDLKTRTSDEAIDDITFEKCRLSLKSPKSPISDITNNNNECEEENNINKSFYIGNEINDSESISSTEEVVLDPADNVSENQDSGLDTLNNVSEPQDNREESRKSSIDTHPDIIRGVTNYTEDELVAHKAKLADLQLRQKLMEEQNKKRKEMLSKALADRTKQTEEEVVKLEKIKKELNILDGQFSQDISVLRKKIDLACLSFADAEKHYLKVEKEFLQAKINLQKKKEKKELLTEHLCALITHNETRKAQKLETLMLQLVEEKTRNDLNQSSSLDDEEPVIVDGVDERTGKMVEIDC